MKGRGLKSLLKISFWITRRFLRYVTSFSSERASECAGVIVPKNQGDDYATVEERRFERRVSVPQNDSGLQPLSPLNRVFSKTAYAARPRGSSPLKPVSPFTLQRYRLGDLQKRPSRV